MKQSPFRVDMDYMTNRIVFVFSSQLYKDNFISRLDENREKINQSLSKRFNMNVKNNILADIKLYDTIEKRGFLIYLEGSIVECLDDITLNGLITTAKE